MIFGIEMEDDLVADGCIGGVRLEGQGAISNNDLVSCGT